MKYDAYSIMIGIALLLMIGFGLVLGLGFVYKKLILKESNFRFKKLIVPSFLVSLGWLMAMALSIWFAGSVNVWIFAATALAINFTLIYLVCERLFELHSKNRLIFSLMLAVILNPAWFVLMGAIA